MPKHDLKKIQWILEISDQNLFRILADYQHLSKNSSFVFSTLPEFELTHILYATVDCRCLIVPRSNRIGNRSSRPGCPFGTFPGSVPIVSIGWFQQSWIWFAVSPCYDLRGWWTWSWVVITAMGSITSIIESLKIRFPEGNQTPVLLQSYNYSSHTCALRILAVLAWHLRRLRGDSAEHEALMRVTAVKTAIATSVRLHSTSCMICGIKEFQAC